MSVEQTGSDQSHADASSTTPALSVGSLIVFVLAVALMLGGFYMMAEAFHTVGYETLMFTGGLLASCLAFFLALSWLPSRER